MNSSFFFPEFLTSNDNNKKTGNKILISMFALKIPPSCPPFLMQLNKPTSFICNSTVLLAKYLLQFEMYVKYGKKSRNYSIGTLLKLAISSFFLYFGYNFSGSRLMFLKICMTALFSQDPFFGGQGQTMQNHLFLVRYHYSNSKWNW